jgi:HAD superfamily hydrolase (TIGR01509 family)
LDGERTSPKGILLDHGNTLVDYFGRADQPVVLASALACVHASLQKMGIDPQGQAPRSFDHPSSARDPDDHRVIPLEDRLAEVYPYIFPRLSGDQIEAICLAFMQPIFERAKLSEDSLPTLIRLKAAGLRTAIVSNSPWGCPGKLWRGEIARHGLADLVDEIVLCTDLGVRKPHPAVYHHTAHSLGLSPAECLFAGDDPRWDVAGPLAVGMPAVLVDRRRYTTSFSAERWREITGLENSDRVPIVHNLSSLLDLLL